MANLEGSVAVVTGSSRGIGAAVAKRLASGGAAVVVNYAHGQAEADQVVQVIEEKGGTALAVKADISTPGGVEALFDAAEQTFGGADILVNNAGTMKLGAIADVADEHFERQVALNFTGVFRGMRVAAQRLRDGGRIISFSSSVAGLYQPGYGVYAATKAAVEAMTHVLAKELGPRGITVNAVSPGPVATAFFLNGKTEEQVEAIAQMNPFKRLGQPEDIAALVAFLASGEGGWVNGQVIRVNGGVI